MGSEEHPMSPRRIRMNWVDMKEARMRERVREWLADEGIEPINEAG
jgi:hypothetical protein